jgi:hypothetical protein
MAKVVLLSYGGNMILTASCLSSISTYFMGMLHFERDARTKWRQQDPISFGMALAKRSNITW